VPRPAGAWLFGVARRLLDADARRRRRAGELTRELGATEPMPAGPSGGRAAPVVTAALSRLAPGDREVLRLVGWEGLTPAELAVALGVRAGTARVRLHRARRALAADPEVRALVDADGGPGPPTLEPTPVAGHG
jgi:RNA polymerase sigma-70 factor (ECF subfamily)